MAWLRSGAILCTALNVISPGPLNLRNLPLHNRALISSLRNDMRLVSSLRDAASEASLQASPQASPGEDGRDGAGGAGRSGNACAALLKAQQLETAALYTAGCRTRLPCMYTYTLCILTCMACAMRVYTGTRRAAAPSACPRPTSSAPSTSSRARTPEPHTVHSPQCIQRTVHH